MIDEGIHIIPMADYLADPCEDPSLSSGTAHRLISESPAHAWLRHPRLGGAESSAGNVADIGSVAHDLFLGGEDKICEINPANFPSSNGNAPIGWTNKAIRSAREDARARGLVPILSADVAQVRAMVAVARQFVADSEIGDLFAPGDPELTLIWREDELGIWCRARPDWLSRDRRLVLHYKTSARSVNPSEWPRWMITGMGYDVSMAFYARGLRRLGEDRDTAHVILAQEQSPPYACAMYGMDASMQIIAAQKVARAMRIWAQCLASNHWPAYASQINLVSPSAWEMEQMESGEWEESAAIREECAP